MPRYRVTFEETTRYVVEFESDEPIDFTDEQEWFPAMDATRSDWPVGAEELDVLDRTLIDSEQLPDEE